MNVARAAQFIEYCMQHDLQVKLNRSSAASLFGHTIARPGEKDTISYSAESFDKIQTFLASNDQQVHYAGAQHSVGVYAITRLLGDLRRRLRDYVSEDGFAPLNMESPRNPLPNRGAATYGGGLALGSGFGLVSARELAHRATRPSEARELPHQRKTRSEDPEAEEPFGSASELKGKERESRT